MLMQYIDNALRHAHYEMIKDEYPFYGEIPELKGVWATGKSLEECRSSLTEAVEDWLFFSIAKGLPIPSIDGVDIRLPRKVSA